MAIEDIVNEAIVANELKDAVRVIFNDYLMEEKYKEK